MRGDTIRAAGLVLTGTGPFTLTDAGNDVTTLAASTGETVSYPDANALTVGSVIVLGVTTMGITTTERRRALQTGTTLLINQRHRVGQLESGDRCVSGVSRMRATSIHVVRIGADGDGPFTLTDAGNDVTTLAAGTGETVSYRDANALTAGSDDGAGGHDDGDHDHERRRAVADGPTLRIDDDIALGSGNLGINAASGVTQNVRATRSRRPDWR